MEKNQQQQKQQLKSNYNQQSDLKQNHNSKLYLSLNEEKNKNLNQDFQTFDEFSQYRPKNLFQQNQQQQQLNQLYKPLNEEQFQQDINEFIQIKKNKSELLLQKRKQGEIDQSLNSLKFDQSFNNKNIKLNEVTQVPYQQQQQKIKPLYMDEPLYSYSSKKEQNQVPYEDENYSIYIFQNQSNNIMDQHNIGESFCSEYFSNIEQIQVSQEDQNYSINIYENQSNEIQKLKSQYLEVKKELQNLSPYLTLVTIQTKIDKLYDKNSHILQKKIRHSALPASIQNENFQTIYTGTISIRSGFPSACQHNLLGVNRQNAKVQRQKVNAKQIVDIINNNKQFSDDDQSIYQFQMDNQQQTCQLNQGQKNYQNDCLIIALNFIRFLTIFKDHTFSEQLIQKLIQIIINFPETSYQQILNESKDLNNLKQECKIKINQIVKQKNKYPHLANDYVVAVNQEIDQQLNNIIMLLCNYYLQTLQVLLFTQNMQVSSQQEGINYISIQNNSQQSQDKQTCVSFQRQLSSSANILQQFPVFQNIKSLKKVPSWSSSDDKYMIDQTQYGYIKIMYLQLDLQAYVQDKQIQIRDPDFLPKAKNLMDQVNNKLNKIDQYCYEMTKIYKELKKESKTRVHSLFQNVPNEMLK